MGRVVLLFFSQILVIYFSMKYWASAVKSRRKFLKHQNRVQLATYFYNFIGTCQKIHSSVRKNITFWNARYDFDFHCVPFFLPVYCEFQKFFFLLLHWKTLRSVKTYFLPENSPMSHKFLVAGLIASFIIHIWGAAVVSQSPSSGSWSKYKTVLFFQTRFLHCWIPFEQNKKPFLYAMKFCDNFFFVF